MRLQRDNDTLLLSLNPLEGRLLLRVLRQLADNYRLAPGELDAETAAAWYSTRGCATARMSEEETREWMAHLREFKGGRLEKIESWAGQVEQAKSGYSHVRILANDASDFLTAINDHRLFVAAQHGIGQEAMDAHSALQLSKLPSDSQEALFEIHFLAWIIEDLLGAIEER